MPAHSTYVTHAITGVFLVLVPCFVDPGAERADNAPPGRKRRESLHDGNLVPGQGCVLSLDLAADVRDFISRTCILWGNRKRGVPGDQRS